MSEKNSDNHSDSNRPDMGMGLEEFLEKLRTHRKTQTDDQIPKHDIFEIANSLGTVIVNAIVRASCAKIAEHYTLDEKYKNRLGDAPEMMAASGSEMIEFFHEFAREFVEASDKEPLFEEHFSTPEQLAKLFGFKSLLTIMSDKIDNNTLDIQRAPGIPLDPTERKRLFADIKYTARLSDFIESAFLVWLCSAISRLDDDYPAQQNKLCLLHLYMGFQLGSVSQIHNN